MSRSRLTNRDNLLGMLREQRAGAWVNQMKMLVAGGYRYGARLMELRRMGWIIETKCLGDGQWLYRLRGKA